MITTVLNHFESGLHISAHVTLKCIRITFMEYKETNFHSCDFLFHRLVSSLECPPWMFPPCKRLISQVSLFLSTAPLCHTLWEFISVCSRYVRKSLAFSVDLNVTCSFCRWFSFECFNKLWQLYFLLFSLPLLLSCFLKANVHRSPRKHLQTKSFLTSLCCLGGKSSAALLLCVNACCKNTHAYTCV